MTSVDLPALYRLGILSAECWAVARWPARRTALYVLYVAGYQTADWFRAALLLFPPNALGVPFSLLLVLLSERSHGLRCLSPCSRIAQAWSCPSTAHQTKNLATIADPCPVTSWRYQGCPCLGALTYTSTFLRPAGDITHRCFLPSSSYDFYPCPPRFPRSFLRSGATATPRSSSTLGLRLSHHFQASPVGQGQIYGLCVSRARANEEGGGGTSTALASRFQTCSSYTSLLQALVVPLAAQAGTDSSGCLVYLGVPQNGLQATITPP